MEFSGRTSPECVEKPVSPGLLLCFKVKPATSLTASLGADEPNDLRAVRWHRRRLPRSLQSFQKQAGKYKYEQADEQQAQLGRRWGPLAQPSFLLCCPGSPGAAQAPWGPTWQLPSVALTRLRVSGRAVSSTWDGAFRLSSAGKLLAKA